MSPLHLRLLAMLRHGDAANVGEVFPADQRAAIRATIPAGGACSDSSASCAWVAARHVYPARKGRRRRPSPCRSNTRRGHTSRC